MYSPKYHERVLADCDAEYSVGCMHQLPSYGQALLMVRLKDFYVCLTSDNKSQLPRQVVCVLQAGIHSLSTCRRVDMCRIASQKASVFAKMRNITMMRMIQGDPLRV